MRWLGRAQVRGKREWVDVHEVFDADHEEVALRKEATRDSLEEAFRLFHDDRIAEAHEAFREYAKYSNKVPGLAVEQDMVLRYPFAMLYHVAKNNSELHDAILKGLQQAHADGSYHELFFNHPSIRSVLEMARLGERRLIEIDNPSLPEALRSIPGQYWMTFDGS